MGEVLALERQAPFVRRDGLGHGPDSPARGVVRRPAPEQVRGAPSMMAAARAMRFWPARIRSGGIAVSVGMAPEISMSQSSSRWSARWRRLSSWSWADSVDRSTLVRVRYRSGVVPWGGGLRDEPRPSLGAVIVRLDISVTGGACRDPLQLHRCELLTCTRRLAWALPERFRIPPRGSWEGCSGLAIAASMR